MNTGLDAASREEAQVVLELQRSAMRILVDQMQDEDEARLRKSLELISQSQRSLVAWTPFVADRVLAPGQ